MDKILLNGLLYSKFGAGISNYTKNLIDNMIEKNDIDFMLSEEVKEKYSNQNNVKFINNINSSKSRIFYEQIRALKYYKGYGVIHFPDYATPIFSSSKKVATIHDMAFFTVGDCYTKGQVETKKFLLDRTIKSADKLICISNFTYTELKKYYPNLNQEKVEIIHNGFNKPLKKYEEASLAKFKLECEYILFVGTISPSKNLINLIEAFREVKNFRKDIKLAIVGKNGWKFENIYKTVEKLNLINDVIFTGYVTNDELETLYKKSMFVVYPSIYEGFGLPPLEALSRNKPVLASNIPVLKEILGESAFYCDPYNKENIAEQILNLIKNREYRMSKCELGLKTVDLYSWEKCANKTYNVYKSLMGE